MGASVSPLRQEGVWVRFIPECCAASLNKTAEDSLARKQMHPTKGHGSTLVSDVGCWVLENVGAIATPFCVTLSIARNSVHPAALRGFGRGFEAEALDPTGAGSICQGVRKCERRLGH